VKNKQKKLIPFNSFSNVKTEDNSGFLETAENVYHDFSGFQAIYGLSGQGVIADATFLLGAFDAHRANGSNSRLHLIVTGATADSYYTLESTMVAGSGSFLSSTNVDMCQWGQTVIATQALNNVKHSSVDNAQYIDLGGSPPQSKTCCVVDDFVILANTYESSVSYPDRIWNSAINDSAGWTPGTNLCDYDDNPELGDIYKVVGGEYCTIFASNGIAVMQRIGGEAGWQVDIKVWHKVSRLFMYGVVKVDNLIYYATEAGFYVFNGESSKKLGVGKLEGPYGDMVDHNVTDVDIFGAHNPMNNTIIWSDIQSPKPHWVYKIDTDEFTTMEIPDSGDYADQIYWWLVPTKASISNLPASISFISRSNSSPQGLKKWSFDVASTLTPDLQTGFYELAPNQWATITRIDTIGEGVTSEDIDILSYDDTKTLIDTITVTETGGSKIRQTGRYFKFRVQSDFDRFSGLKVEFVARGRR